MSSLQVFNRVYRLENSQSCWYFWSLMWTSAPSNLLTGSPTPLPPFPVWISTGVSIHTVSNRGWGPHTDKHLPPSKIFNKSRHLGFDVFISVSLSVGLAVSDFVGCSGSGSCRVLTYLRVTCCVVSRTPCRGVVGTSQSDVGRHRVRY